MAKAILAKHFDSQQRNQYSTVQLQFEIYSSPSVTHSRVLLPKAQLHTQTPARGNCSAYTSCAEGPRILQRS